MEALVFILDALALVVMVVLAVRNERRPSDRPEIGPFRYIETLPTASKTGSPPWRRR
jgi:hypothetical protein